VTNSSHLAAAQVSIGTRGVFDRVSFRAAEVKGLLIHARSTLF